MTNDAEFRVATLADALEFFGGYPPARFRGFVAVMDGAVVGIGGVYYHGGVMVAFSDLKPEIRKHKKIIAKGCRLLCKFFEELNMPVYALANENEPTAPYLLAKLGFKPTGQVTDIGEYLVKVPD